jgi:hypothetical protein
MDGAAVFIDTDVDFNLAFINLGQAFGFAAKTVIPVYFTIFPGWPQELPFT